MLSFLSGAKFAVRGKGVGSEAAGCHWLLLIRPSVATRVTMISAWLPALAACGNTDSAESCMSDMKVRVGESQGSIRTVIARCL